MVELYKSVDNLNIRVIMTPMEAGNMKILFDNNEIITIAKRIGQEIAHDYEGTNPIIVCVLNGAKPFHSELLKHVNIPYEVDALRAKSYDGSESTGSVEILKDLSLDIEGRNVILIEDIIDTGHTMSKLIPMLKKRNPLSIRVATMLDKKCRRKVDFEADYVGATIPNHFVIGFGLDFDGKFRELPYIGIYDESVNETNTTSSIE